MSRVMRELRSLISRIQKKGRSLSDSAYGKMPAGAGPGESFSIVVQPQGGGTGRNIEFGTERPTKITRTEG